MSFLVFCQIFGEEEWCMNGFIYFLVIFFCPFRPKKLGKYQSILFPSEIGSIFLFFIKFSKILILKKLEKKNPLVAWPWRLCRRLGLVVGQVGLGVRVEGFRIAFWQLVKLVQDFRVGLVGGQVSLGFQGLGFQGRVGSWSSWFRVLGFRILGQGWQLVKLVQGFRVQDFRVGLVVGQVGLGFQNFRLGLVVAQVPLSTQTNVE